MQKTIVFFDFDGTTTRKDTMLELIKFNKGKAGYYMGMLALAPVMVAMKAKLISNAKAKEKMLGYFFGGMELAAFNKICDEFCATIIPGLIRPDALQKIKEHQLSDIEVVIVSASAENWIRGWCNAVGVKYLATKLEVVNNKITGKLDGVNCNAEEKVCRIKQHYHLSDYNTIYCYGDTEGDQPMLQIATHPSFRVFVQ